MTQEFKGIIPPMITPLLSDWKLDHAGVKKIVNHMIDGSVHGIFILGTTGESTSLSYQTRRELIRQAAVHIDQRVPLLVGITDTSIEESLDLATLASQSEAAAVVAAPPYYFNLGQEELYEYYWDLADRLTLPLFLYNMPSLTKMPIAVDTAVRLSKHPNIIGLKDSSANAVYFQALKQSISDKDFTFFVGPEEIMAETVMMGGNGGVNGGANLFPKLYVNMYEAAVNQDITKVRLLQKQIMEIAALLYTVGQYSSSYLKGVKGAAFLLGLCNNYTAPPIRPFREKEMKQIAGRLATIQSNLSTIEL